VARWRGGAVARADVLTFKAGGKVEGEILHIDGATVEIRLRDTGETRTYPRESISGILRKSTAAQSSSSSGTRPAPSPPNAASATKPNPYQKPDPAQTLRLALTDLESVDVVARAYATKALARIGPRAAPAVPDLLRHFTDEGLVQEVTTFNGVPGPGNGPIYSIAALAADALGAIGPAASS
jgi:hypothetical protein